MGPRPALLYRQIDGAADGQVNPTQRGAVLEPAVDTHATPPAPFGNAGEFATVQERFDARPIQVRPMHHVLQP
jgi:hypothetical protein